MSRSNRVVASLIALAGVVAGCQSAEPPESNQEPSQMDHATQLGKPDLVIQNATNELKGTHVSAYLDRAHTPGHSMLWCATMWSAWDSMSGLMKSPFRISGGAGNPEPAMSAALAGLAWDPSVLDAESYVAMAGYGPAIVHRIKDELASKFKGAASPSILPQPDSLNPDDILAYSYLFKNLQFEHPFERNKNGMQFNSPPASGTTSSPDTLVQAFGLSSEIEDWASVASQVVVKHYAAPDDFVVELRTKDPNDRLIVARLLPGATLKATVDTAMSRAAGDESLAPITKEERFMVPLMNFDVTRNFEEIEGKYVATAGYTDYIVAYALQNIRFRLDERGAILKSEAAIGLTRTAIRPAQPRRFVCDGPFLLVMARKGAATPYFAAWIANDELLVKQTN